MKKTPHSVEEAEQGEKEIRDHITYRRSCLPEPSLPWPIDAPNWYMTQDAKARFTAKFMGLAFFVCPCRSSPVNRFEAGLTAKQLFYRCPFDEVREEYHPANVIRVLSSRELEDKYGERLRQEIKYGELGGNPSPDRLSKLLRKGDPVVSVHWRVAMNWLRAYASHGAERRLSEV